MMCLSALVGIRDVFLLAVLQHGGVELLFRHVLNPWNPGPQKVLGLPGKPRKLRVSTVEDGQRFST